MKLIVGLGNPGSEYAETRHNVGWRVAEELAARAAMTSWRRKFDAAVAVGPWRGEKIALLRPLTYMNESGRAVRQAVDFWRIETEDLLVVLDDMALEVGRLRLRTQGSDGGHKGLASVVAHVGHERFARLRVGIGAAPDADRHRDFVLAPFAKDERPVVEEAVRQAADAVECWITRGPEEAMNLFNRTREEGEL